MDLGLCLGLLSLVPPAAFSSHGPPVHSPSPASPQRAGQPVIAVIDSGVDATQPYLAGQLVAGFDFVDNDSDPDDVLGHGTDTAAIVAAVGPNPGVCTPCKVMPLKAADEGGALSHARLVQAINFAVANGADAILVGSGSIGVDPAVASAVAAAEAAGIPVIAPAGSNGLGQTYFPAALPTVISVVPSDAAGRFARSANSTLRESVAAQGDDIQVAVPEGGTAGRGGSSVAAAFVAGVVGQALITDPSLTPEQVRQVIRNGVDPMNFANFYDWFDLGSVNLAKVLSRANASFPDLAVTRLSTLPSTPLLGQPNTLRARVSNLGNVPTGPFTLDVVWGATALPTVNLPSLAPGQNAEVDVALPTAGATGAVLLSASVSILPGETETANNTRATSVSYVTSPSRDLILEVGAISAPVVEAGTLTFPVTVRNVGNQDEPAVTVEVLVDETAVSTHPFNLPVGAEASFTGSYALPTLPDRDSRTLIVKASMPGATLTDEHSDWRFAFQVGSNADDGRLQYADPMIPFVMIMDAPWKTVRDALPVLFFFPRFNHGTGRVFEMVVRASNANGAANAVIVRDHSNNAMDVPANLAGITILSDLGAPRTGITGNPATVEIKPFWHYILRIPTASIAGGAAGVHYLRCEVLWDEKKGNQRQDRTNFKILRTQVDPDAGFPKLDASDRYYDAHVHTIAEQTRSTLRYAPLKNFGGPIAMLLESSYALGMTEVQLNAGNWNAFKDKLVTTDHNVFYTAADTANVENKVSVPDFGPTQPGGPAQEFDWYRTNLGRLAGEEVALASGSTQAGPTPNLGHHFLAYDTNHVVGPWHGGNFALLMNAPNPNTMVAALAAMRLANGTGFGYAAHPNLKGFEWPPEYFQQAIGLGAGNNSNAGPHVHGIGTPDFIYTGSQVYNARFPMRQAKAFNPALLSELSPFGGNADTLFTLDNNWLTELNASLSIYYQQVRDALLYSFQQTPMQRFIRKIYMVAGTDAHGDFNYTEDYQNLSNTIVLSDNAYGRVRTYVLVHDRPSSGNADDDAVLAYKEGSTALTDGPIAIFQLDSDGRHDPPAGVPRWHDATSQWENADGRIGGSGKFDGGRTILVPFRTGGGGDQPNGFIRSRWKRSTSTPNSSLGQNYDLIRLTQGAQDTIQVPTGNDDEDKKQALPANAQPTAVSAYLLQGLDTNASAPERERVITNPIWAAPVGIEVASPAACPFPPNTVTVTFHFPISMKNQQASVKVRPLDNAGNSENPEHDLLPVAGTGWATENNVEFAKYTARNPNPIPCPSGFWNAETHQAENYKYSYVTYMVLPKELNDNELNDIARTWTLTQVCAAPGNNAPAGPGCGAASPPGLTVTTPSVGSDFSVTLADPPFAFAPAFLALAAGPAVPIPLGPCLVYPNLSGLLLFQIGTLGPSASTTVVFAIPAVPALCGGQVTLQGVVTTGVGPLFGLDLSNGVTSTFGL